MATTATIFHNVEEKCQTANWCIKNSPKPPSLAEINVLIEDINYMLHCTSFKSTQVFLRCFRDPIRILGISKNYHRVPRTIENRVP